MKKVLVLSCLTLGGLAAAQQQASAWCNFKFSAGINCSYTGGDKCLLWGLYKSGPMPGCCPAPGYGDYGAAGYDMGQGPAAHVNNVPVAQPNSIKPVDYQSMMYYPSAYQPVGYYNYGYYPAPSYWYGR
jgi:hypothetical protein